MPSSFPSPAELPRNAVFALVFAAVIGAAAIALRFAQLTELEFDIDESCSMLYTSAPEGIIKSLHDDANAPLYFFTLKGWTKIFGTAESSARGFSAFAGCLVVLLVPLVMRAYMLPPRAMLWGMALAAFAPLQIYYSQTARGYILVHLIMLLLLWTFAFAARRGTWGAWALFAGAQLASFYAHNMFLPAAIGFWAGSAFLGMERADYKKWTVAQAVVIVLYLPWLSRALGNPCSPGLEWIAGYWKTTPPLMAIPRSLEVFGVGGRIPSYFRDLGHSPADAIRYLSILFFGASAAALFFFNKDETEEPIIKPGAMKFLLAVLFAPLLFQFAYSIVRCPIYLVGRYDSISQPVYFILIGAGIHALQARAENVNRPAARVVLGILLAVLVLYSLLPRYRPIPAMHEAAINPTRYRGKVLKDNAKSDELIICLGIEGAKISYERMKLGIAAGLETFPRSTLGHMGWFNPRTAFADHDAVKRDVKDFGEMFRGNPPRYRGAWIVMDSKSKEMIGKSPPPHNVYTDTAGLLLQELREAGLQFVKLPELKPDIPEPLGLLYMRRPDSEEPYEKR